MLANSARGTAAKKAIAPKKPNLDFISHLLVFSAGRMNKNTRLVENTIAAGREDVVSRKWYWGDILFKNGGGILLGDKSD
jgi:hypothetical protein